MTARQRAIAALAAAGAALAGAPAHADLRLSELIVELQPGKQTRDDVEVWNDSPDRAFVATEPREIVNPGSAAPSVFRDPDPEKLGILVSPSRMILEPGQRKMIRIAAVSGGSDREHVYRVTVKPVVGAIQAQASGIKILVGYDLLVLVRPAEVRTGVSATRKGRALTFNNEGNVSVELVDGRQCGPAKGTCTGLPGKRLYAGGSWTVRLMSDQPAEYTLKFPGRSDHRIF